MPMNNERDRMASASLRGRANNAMPRFGGTIPSPEQSYNVEARSRSIMARPEMATAEDIPNMSQEEIDMYNKPQMNISDAFFGPDNGERFDIVAFITNLLRGNR